MCSLNGDDRGDVVDDLRRERPYEFRGAPNEIYVQELGGNYSPEAQRVRLEIERAAHEIAMASWAEMKAVQERRWQEGK